MWNHIALPLATLSSAWVVCVCLAKCYLYHKVSESGRAPQHVWACPGRALRYSPRVLGLHVLFMGYALARASGVLTWAAVACPWRLLLHCAHYALMYPLDTILGVPRPLACTLNHATLACLVYVDLADTGDGGARGGVAACFALQVLSGFWVSPGAESSMIPLALFVRYNDLLWAVIQDSLKPMPALPTPAAARALLAWSRPRFVQCLRSGEPQPRTVALLLFVFHLLVRSLRVRHDSFTKEMLFQLPPDEARKRTLLLEAETSGFLDYMAPARAGDAGTPAILEKAASAHLCLTHVSVSLAVYDSIMRLPPTATVRRLLYPFYCLSTTIFYLFGAGTFQSHACVLELGQGELLEWVDAEAGLWGTKEAFAAYRASVFAASARRGPVDTQVRACRAAIHERLAHVWREHPPSSEETKAFTERLPFAEAGECMELVVDLLLEIIVLHPLRGECAYRSGIAAAYVTPHVMEACAQDLAQTWGAVQNFGGCLLEGQTDADDEFGVLAAVRQAMPVYPECACALRSRDLGRVIT